MEALFEGIQKEKLREYEFHAAIHGVDLTGKNGSSNSPSTPSSNSKKEIPMFGDPEEFQSLSKEEKEKRTNDMMSMHKRWAGQTFKKGK